MANGDGMGMGGGGESIPPRRVIAHYHGDAVRALFVMGALVLVVAQSTGADLPLQTFGSVLAAVVLVVAAGITNPAIGWIHWVDALLAIFGTLLFGTTAVAHYRAGANVFDFSFIFTEALTLLSLLALYFTVRTIRGMLLRVHLS